MRGDMRLDRAPQLRLYPCLQRQLIPLDKRLARLRIVGQGVTLDPDDIALDRLVYRQRAQLVVPVFILGIRGVPRIDTLAIDRLETCLPGKHPQLDGEFQSRWGLHRARLRLLAVYPHTLDVSDSHLRFARPLVYKLSQAPLTITLAVIVRPYHLDHLDTRLLRVSRPCKLSPINRHCILR